MRLREGTRLAKATRLQEAKLRFTPESVRLEPRFFNSALCEVSLLALIPETRETVNKENQVFK